MVLLTLIVSSNNILCLDLEAKFVRSSWNAEYLGQAMISIHLA